MGEKGSEVTWQCPGGALCFDLDTRPQRLLYQVTLAEWDLRLKMSPLAEMGRPSPMWEGSPGGKSSGLRVG